MALDDVRTRSIRSLTLSLYVKYVALGSGSFLLYDYLLTLSDEVRFVWPAPWSVGKVLFFLTRYPIYADFVSRAFRLGMRSPSPTLCLVLNGFSGWLTIVTLSIAELIMLMRVWAMWGRSKRLGIGLAVVVVVLFAAAATMFAEFAKRYQYLDLTIITSPPLPGCHPKVGSNLSFVSFIVLLAFELLMLIMTLIKAVRDLPQKPTSFIRKLYWDGVFYYVTLSTISLLNVVTLLVAPPELYIIVSEPQRSLHSILSARLLLRLREDAVRRQSLMTFTAPVGNSIFERDTASRASMMWNPEQTGWFGDANSNLAGDDP